MEALQFLRDAVNAFAERSPEVACMGHWGKVGIPHAWNTRLSVALQKGNTACVLQASRVRGFAGFFGDSDWEEDIDDLRGRLLPRLAGAASRHEAVVLEEPCTVHRKSRISSRRSRTV